MVGQACPLIGIQGKKPGTGMVLIETFERFRFYESPDISPASSFGDLKFSLLDNQ